ncbi:MAG: helix-turn-helix transcriptional regulator [Limosilactobacillus sp.]|uniref:helix-turn-helix domain-containing protein n=1 Tax=Limosilactobacillus sp. TaxID=2773925 RepID=UPI0026FBA49D|nr:helix-turn-helix transcriptional regulator [Limosilactobacillus sp.]
MKLRGDVLKQIRRKRGLSQTALAEGICTQATISLMEKQDRLPKMDILTAICERLNIQTERIVENDVSAINDIFNRSIDALTNQEFEEATRLISQLSVKNLESDFDKQRYYFLLGMVQIGNGDIGDAIFNFELVLTQFSTSSANIYLALTTAGMALAYLRRNDKERAMRLTNRAVRLINNKNLLGSLHQWAFINCQISELYYELGEPLKAIESAERGVELCRERDSMFILDQLYWYLGRAYLVTGKTAEAKQCMEIAKSIAIARHGKVNEQAIEKELKKLSRN